jgi:hypothetical protein
MGNEKGPAWVKIAVAVEHCTQETVSGQVAPVTPRFFTVDGTILLSPTNNKSSIWAYRLGIHLYRDNIPSPCRNLGLAVSSMIATQLDTPR